MLSASVVQAALTSNRSERLRTAADWQQQESLLRMQLQQQSHALQLSESCIAMLGAQYAEEQHCTSQQHAEVGQPIFIGNARTLARQKCR